MSGSTLLWAEVCICWGQRHQNPVATDAITQEPAATSATGDAGGGNSYIKGDNSYTKGKNFNSPGTIQVTDCHLLSALKPSTLGDGGVVFIHHASKVCPRHVVDFLWMDGAPCALGRSLCCRQDDVTGTSHVSRILRSNFTATSRQLHRYFTGTSRQLHELHSASTPLSRC